MSEVDILTAYIDAAMRKARYEILPEGEGYFGNIVEQGVWANADSLEACREALQEALDKWIILGLTRLWPFRNQPFADQARAGRRRLEIR